ncbi:innexin inx3-like [Hydractinia symbiolongicarpus]|uniref:innexin inx3-like n=1 Tax=Hydractinia symbiolongicarpus TaxID=13093 RepID=UPI00254BA336|nr:innexin inx3-like [Hydractinia symbiolongicarpus]
MSGVTGDIKKLFNFKYKTRNDSITDQYNRVYMVKAMLVAAFLTGMKWYKDPIRCVIPKNMDSSTLSSYGPESCWINGFYVYKELRHLQNFQGYYGLPNRAEQNGTNIYSGRPCVANKHDTSCKPLTKMFYLQYQWFPFYLATLALLFYLPYIWHRYVNNDLLTLKSCIKSQSPDIDDIVHNYFSNYINAPNQQNMKIILNIMIKVSYLLVNVLSFVFTDSVLNGDFRRFGTNWIRWSLLRNSMAHNYVGLRTTIKPGEMLLPTFGFCDIMEMGADKIHHVGNNLTSVCELSQHVLYHYVLMAIWFLLVLGMVVSVIGIGLLLFQYIYRTVMFGKCEVAAMRVFSVLTIRQGEYLDFIRKKNVPVYGALIRKLYAAKFGSRASSEAESTMKEMESPNL